MKAKLLAEVFPDYQSPYHLYRSKYKYVDCGPWIAMSIDGNVVSCDDLPTEWGDFNIDDIRVGSIVEGVDECTESYRVLCVGDPKKIPTALEEAIEAVDKEANNIWEKTHGCEVCAETAGMDFDRDIGMIPVDPSCKGCDGGGTIF